MENNHHQTIPAINLSVRLRLSLPGVEENCRNCLVVFQKGLVKHYLGGLQQMVVLKGVDEGVNRIR